MALGAPCRSCGEPIIMLRNPNSGNRVPVELTSTNADDDDNTPFDAKRHVNHFVRCPGADKHRKKRRGKSR